MRNRPAAPRSGLRRSLHRALLGSLLAALATLAAANLAAAANPSAAANPAAAANPSAAANPGPGAPVRHVVIVGLSGLRWSDVSPTATPTLWRLAGQGSVGSLVDFAVLPLTCPADGWLTLNAGARAQYRH